MNPREERGLALAEAAQITPNGKGWIVPSQAGRGRYTVTLNGDSPRCTCPDHEIRGQKCKHIYAVEYTLEKEVSPNGETTVTETVTETVKVTYKQNWPAYNAAQTEEKHRFAALLSALCKGVSEPEQTMGRPRLPLGDMVFASAYKVYVGFSSRRFTTDLHDAHAGGLIRSTPHFNSVSRYLSDPEITNILKNLVTVSSLPLKAVETDFAVDSSGFSTSRFVRWFNKKYGRETDNREWVKVHLMCGVNTKVVAAVDISGWTANDTTYFVPLVERTAEHFQVREVAADKAYLSRKNLKAVEQAGGTPYVPFKSNTVEPTGDSAWSRMYGYFMCHRDDFLEHYHKRSNIETAYSMIKGKFGSSLRSKSDSGQINEALCKVLCHNICVLVQAIHELGIEPSF
jgi:transposase